MPQGGAQSFADVPEHLDVLIVGAGLSGIGGAWRVQEACPTATYAIFEARDVIGGTWDLFRYPGIRSDSDMFTFGYPFRPWSRPESIAQGEDILDYIKETAREGGIDTHIRFHHRITRADWSSEDARWTVTFERTTGGSGQIETGQVETGQLTCSFLFSCSGYYRYDQGYTPDFDGIDDFAGQIIHPQQWPQDLDYEDKNIVVIGSGATAVTLIPSLAKDAKHVTMLQRSPTYIAALPATNPLGRVVRAVTPKRFEGTVMRWMSAVLTQGFFALCQKWPQRARKMLRKGVEMFLGPDYDIDTHFSPRYDPWDQRLCVVPEGDLFRAITSGSASVETDTIDRFVPEGVRTTSGNTLEADIVVTATGLELLFIGGIELSVDGEIVDVTERFAYKGMMLEGVPNFAMSVGYTNASWTLKSDLIARKVGRMLQTIAETGNRQVTPTLTDSDRSGRPLLNLTAGYVQRSIDKFPKQGMNDPWKVHESYVRDYRLMAPKRDDDSAMVFSNPASARSDARQEISA